MMEMSAELTAAVLENILRHGKFNIPTRNAMENAVRILREDACLLKEQDTKTGKWIEQEDYNLDTYYDCSVCGESWSTVEGTPWENGMNYCPHCGARMESILCDNRTEGR